MKETIGFILMIVAGIFGFAETIYFGNTLLPNTKSEFICDGIAFIVFLIGLYLFKSKK